MRRGSRPRQHDTSSSMPAHVCTAQHRRRDHEAGSPQSRRAMCPPWTTPRTPRGDWSPPSSTRSTSTSRGHRRRHRYKMVEIMRGGSVGKGRSLLNVRRADRRSRDSVPSPSTRARAAGADGPRRRETLTCLVELSATHRRLPPIRPAQPQALTRLLQEAVPRVDQDQVYVADDELPRPSGARQRRPDPHNERAAQPRVVRRFAAIRPLAGFRITAFGWRVRKRNRPGSSSSPCRASPSAARYASTRPHRSRERVDVTGPAAIDLTARTPRPDSLASLLIGSR